MGLGYDRTIYMPYGELLSLIAVEQIKVEGAKYKHPVAYDEEVIPDIF